MTAGPNSAAPEAPPIEQLADRRPTGITNPGVEELPERVTELRIPSGDGDCAAWHYGPGTSGMCIVMTPGAGALKELGLPRFAERFADAGHDVLLFDFRHFGQSGGEPRQVLRIGRQREDLRAAVQYARAVLGFEYDRIVLWGMSFGAGVAMDVAARMPGLAGIVAQCPVTSGPYEAIEVPPVLSMRLGLHAFRDLVRAAVGRDPHYIPLAGGPGAVATRSGTQALRAQAALNPDGYPWPQDCSARFMMAVPLWSSLRTVGRIHCPMFVVLGEDDELISRRAARKAARKAPHAELLEIPGDHYEPFRDSSFEKVVAAQLLFLERNAAPVELAKAGHA
ncbi:MAG TPA: alpha/beta fold hydrolase [Thermoleophilaceae bacterium]